MLGIGLCVIAFAAAYWAGRRGLVQGLIVVLAAGYFYGILRANIIAPASHFIFDAALVGFYLTQPWRKSNGDSRGMEAHFTWVLILIGWPLLLCLMPFQTIGVSLVGLRGNILLIPVLLLGRNLKDRDLMQLSKALVALNVIALGFGAAEYFTDVQRFFPRSAVTTIIYSSADAGGGNWRIPAIFSSAHAYGGTMVATLPYLIAAWSRFEGRRDRMVAVCGISAAMLGVLMSATRQNFLVGGAMIMVTVLTARLKPRSYVMFAALVVLMAYLALTNERFQRFKSLGDTDLVMERIAGSVNRSFLEILVDYPMGNGVGSASSMPYFLQGQVRNPIALENEYARILCEQGIIGLLLWISFIGWCWTCLPLAFGKSRWQSGRRLAWSVCMLGFGTGMIGVGLLTSIPASLIFLLSLSWSTGEPAGEGSKGWGQTGRGILMRQGPAFTGARGIL